MRLIFSSGLILCSCLSWADFETPASVQAVDIVPESLLAGPNHRVSPDVSNNGLQNEYLVETDFGVFRASGISDLRVKIREADALTYLQSMSRTSVFLESLKDAGVKSLESVVAIFSSPIQTLKGLPSGVGRLFSGYLKGAERGIHTTKRILKGNSKTEIQPEEFRKTNYLLSDGERTWASELKTDPYSTNLKLRAAIANMSVVQFIGGLPVDLALPVGASLTIDIVGEISNDIYQKNAAELELDNRDCLVPLQVDEEVIDKFINAKYLTPTQQTVFCASLTKLTGVENRSELVDQLTAAESFEASQFLINTSGLLAWYHETQRPLQRIVQGETLPQAITKGNRYLVILPADYLYWTESTAERVKRMRMRNRERPAAAREFWVVGQFSERTRTELTAHNWLVKDITNTPVLRTIYEYGSARIHADRGKPTN